MITPTSNCAGRWFNQLFSCWRGDASSLHSVTSHPSLFREAEPRALAWSSDCSPGLSVGLQSRAFQLCDFWRCLRKDCFGRRSRARSQSSAGLQVNKDGVSQIVCFCTKISHISSVQRAFTPIIIVMFPVRQRKWGIPDSSSSRKEEQCQQVCRYLQRQTVTLATTLTLAKDILKSSGTT